MSSELTVTFWLARTEKGNLWLFNERPIRVKTSKGDVWETGSREQFAFERNQFPDVTFSNSPAPVEAKFSEALAEPVCTLQLIAS